MRIFRDIQINQRELSGAFGDIGTDFPLIVAMILAADLHIPSVLIIFGIMQILSGLIYKMPMPVQPLKAMATLVIAQKIGGNILLGAGLSIGIVMLLLSLTGILTKLSILIPKAVIRGIQLGLGISLCVLSFKNYVTSDGVSGYILAFISFIIILLFLNKKNVPVSIIVILLGILYAVIFKVNATELQGVIGINFPNFHVPALEDITKGFILLALPQIPLSLGNSIIATRQAAEDFFPDRPPLSVKKIGITYSFLNLISPFFNGIPCCHGSGGMVGHYTFGGRTGGSVIIYGIFYMVLGLFFANGFQTIIKIFPLPVLGIILLFEGIALMILVKDVMGDGKTFFIALLVGIISFGLPYGFVIALVAGTILFHSPLKLPAFSKVITRKKDKIK